ncbi:MAG: hypothetical protein ABR577_20295, partial [Pyrinomonadaceae bacterium]
ENAIATNNRLAEMFRKYLPRGEAEYLARLKKRTEETGKRSGSTAFVARVEQGRKSLGLRAKTLLFTS